MRGCLPGVDVTELCHRETVLLASREVYKHFALQLCHGILARQSGDQGR